MEGVVNTNEDSKAVQRDLGRGKTLAGNCYLGGGGMCGPGSTWGHLESREEGRAAPGLGWSWEQTLLAWVWVTGANQNLGFSHLEIEGRTGR